MKALSEGADGVLLAGCHFGDCHYIEGNYKAMRRFLLLKKALDELGLEPGRVRLEWVSAGEGERFAQVITEMVEEVRNLGPLNWTGGHKVRAPLELPEDQLPSEEETQHEASIEKREGVVV
jgi:coenzyme F420-reducing hydrogenase delta subunit